MLEALEMPPLPRINSGPSSSVAWLQVMRPRHAKVSRRGRLEPCYNKRWPLDQGSHFSSFSQNDKRKKVRILRLLVYSFL